MYQRYAQRIASVFAKLRPGKVSVRVRTKERFMLPPSGPREVVSRLVVGPFSSELKATHYGTVQRAHEALNQALRASGIPRGILSPRVTQSKTRLPGTYYPFEIRQAAEHQEALLKTVAALKEALREIRH